tara:strand:+ start:733 stop:885 length:153 start_codon:yes stop_codon:yes gene_type:complete
MKIMKFKTFKSLEKYWLENFNSFRKNKESTKVIGKTLIIFKKNKEIKVGK